MENPSGKKTRYSRVVRVSVSIVSAVLTLMSLGLAVTGGYIWHTLSRIQSEGELQGEYNLLMEDPEGTGLETGEDPEASLPPSYAQDIEEIPVKGNTQHITNILLLGLDGRSGYKGTRSDTMIILSINDQKQTIRLISLMRDTAVILPGYDRDGDGRDDYNKLNAAFSRGGFDLLSKTIEQNFRLKIDQYIGVNFVTFPIAVDAAGGLDLTLTRQEAAMVCAADQTLENWQKGFRPVGTQDGQYHLNGYQTLQYARIRKLAGNDFKRTERQRIVISALLEKAKGLNFFQLLNMVNQTVDHVVSNMNENELLQYAVRAGKYARYTIDSDGRLPLDGENTNRPLLPGGSEPVWMTDPSHAVRVLHEWIYT